MKMKVKNRPRPKHGRKYTKYQHIVRTVIAGLPSED